MILCVGTTPVWQRSMVFDHVMRNEVNRASTVHEYASGKAVNVARVLHTLGEDPVVTGFAGGDRGAAMLRDLDAAGVRHEFVRVEAPTRQCITVIDGANGTATELVEESTAVADADWTRLEETVDRLIYRADGLVLSGSLPPGAPQDFYERCMRSTGRIGSSPTRVVVDARGTPLREALRRRGFVSKMNRDELAATVGRAITTDAELLAAMHEVMPVGGATAVTLGAAGAVVADARGVSRVCVPPVPTRSAVGSGDAFLAGFILGLVRGQPLAEACALGAACGAANAMTDLAGHLSPVEVDRILPQVRVEPF
jgi:tagatose 6-phosphate kinase